MASSRPPPPAYNTPSPLSSPALPNSPPPPYKSPTRMAGNIPRVEIVPGYRPHEIQHAVVVADTYHESSIQQVARVDGGGVNEPRRHVARVASRDGGERTASAGESRADHGEENRMKKRCSSWILQLVVWALFLGMLISIGRHVVVKKHNEGRSFSNDDYKNESSTILPLALFSTFLFCSLIWYGEMCYMAGTLQFVANLDRELNVQQYVQKLRTTTPTLQFKACCYHTETRTRQVPSTTTDSRGYSTTTYTTETYVVDVVTHSASEEYDFQRWEDATAVLSGTDSVVLTKLYLSKELGFLTDSAEPRMLAAYDAFCAAHRFDVFQSYSKALLVEGFKERILCLSNAAQLPWWVNSRVYWVASVFLLNLPYRQAMDWNTSVIRHTITKNID